ncbi:MULTISPECIES: ABC transporter permease [Bordetella]|uniref:Transport permease protein n=2 Tax=Bordetella parapertussis TaxID=519 RepID=K0MCS6_BORPB|nr:MULTISPECIES: ABC transporter permease [Bordetella]ABF72477.1 WbmL [Bordetella parapertussis]KAB1451556.1 ABC transporter permease [Bordetella bronchiseptica]KAB1576800.1 ABC transporter permease [Bordetella bronchiseptica]KDB67987.1 ABC transporter, ATP-binding protein [Bordetella bronchiseptica A1-7]KDB72767.1 ABC transporter, ATP-binding protein [Bordetella bronchiseptica B20-10725633]
MLGFHKRDASLAYNFFIVNLRDKYLGSGLGMIWAIVNPIFMLGIFTFVFGFVYKSRLPGADTTLAYVIWLISGYGPWIAISEAITMASTSIVSASGLIKNLAFKSEILPISAAATGVVPLTVSLVFLAILMVVDGNPLTWHAAWIPLIIFLQFFFVAAIGMWLAALTVFVRDITFVIPNVLVMILFGTPIFYPIDVMPQIVKTVSQYNPFFILVEGYRQPLIHHQNPDLGGLLYLFAIATILLWSGLRAFRRVKGNFEAVL